MAGHLAGARFLAGSESSSTGWFRLIAASMAALLLVAVGPQAESGDVPGRGSLTRASLEPVPVSITRSSGAQLRSAINPQGTLDFGLFYEHGVLQIILTDPPAASWAVSFDSLPGMFAQPPSGNFTAPGVQYCNIYLDRTGVPFGAYQGSIIVQWSIPATDVVASRFRVADTLGLGRFAPSNATPLTPGATTFFEQQDTLSLWSTPLGHLHFEMRANGGTPIGADVTADVPGRGVFIWWPDRTITIPLTANTVTSLSRMTIGLATIGDDSARVDYVVQGAHYPQQCIPPADIRVRCGEPASNRFRRAGSDPVPVWWRQVSGPGTTDSATGQWTLTPACAQIGSFMVAAALSDSYFPNADTCEFQVAILDSSGFQFNQGDADCNAIVDVFDIVGMIDYVFGGTSVCYTLLADWDCNGSADVLDLVGLIDYTFGGGPGAHSTMLVSASASVAVGDTATFVASTCLPGREPEIQWFSAGGSPSAGSGPIFKTTFGVPGSHTTLFRCCEGKPDSVTTTCW